MTVSLVCLLLLCALSIQAELPYTQYVTYLQDPVSGQFLWPEQFALLDTATYREAFFKVDWVVNSNPNSKYTISAGGKFLSARLTNYGSTGEMYNTDASAPIYNQFNITPVGTNQWSIFSPVAPYWQGTAYNYGYYLEAHTVTDGSGATWRAAGFSSTPFAWNIIYTPASLRTYQGYMESWGNNIYSFSLSAVVRLSTSGVGRIFDHITVNQNNGFLFDVYPTNKLRVITSPNVLSTNTQLAVGVRTHVAVTYDGQTTRIYVNGIQTDSMYSTTSLVQNNLYLRCGTDANGGTAFPGDVNRALYWKSVVLSPVEMYQDYKIAVAQGCMSNFC